MSPSSQLVDRSRLRSRGAIVPCDDAFRYNWRNNSVLVMHNLAGDAREVTIQLGDRAGHTLSNLLTHDHGEADARARHHIILEPYGYRWYRIGGLVYLLDRSSY